LHQDPSYHCFNLPLTTQNGDTIATFHQMTFLGEGKRKLSFLQMEAYGADINYQTLTGSDDII
jgi:hypothetical protein